jgi:hypothetical protein
MRVWYCAVFCSVLWCGVVWCGVCACELICLLTPLTHCAGDKCLLMDDPLHLEEYHHPRDLPDMQDQPQLPVCGLSASSTRVLFRSAVYRLAAILSSHRVTNRPVSI